MNSSHLLAITLILAMPYVHGMQDESESSSDESSSSYEEKEYDNDHVKPNTGFEYFSPITALKFDDNDDDNFTIITGHENGILKMLRKDNKSSSAYYHENLHSPVTALCSVGHRKDDYGHVNKVFVIGTEGGTVYSKEFKQEYGIACSYTARNEKSHAILSPVMALRYDSKKKRVISGHSNGEIYFFKQPTFEIEKSLSTHSAVLALDIAPQSNELATGHENGKVSIYSLEDYALKAEGNLKSPIIATEFNPHTQKKKLVIGHPDGTIRIYSGSRLEGYRTVDSGSGLLTLCFNPNGTSFATAHSNGTVQIWSSSEPNERIATLTKSTSPVTALTYNHSGTRVAAGHKNKKLYVYETFNLWKKNLYSPKNTPSSIADKKDETENGKEEKEDKGMPTPYAGYSPNFLPSAPPEKNEYAISYHEKPPQKKKLSPIVKEEKENNNKSKKKKKCKCILL